MRLVQFRSRRAPRSARFIVGHVAAHRHEWRLPKYRFVGNLPFRSCGRKEKAVPRTQAKVRSDPGRPMEPFRKRALFAEHVGSETGLMPASQGAIIYLRAPVAWKSRLQKEFEAGMIFAKEVFP
jgi:hypothetical protein